MIYKKGFDGDSSFRNEGNFSSSSSSSKELFQEEAQEVSGTSTQLVVMAEAHEMRDAFGRAFFGLDSKVL